LPASKPKFRKQWKSPYSGPTTITALSPASCRYQTARANTVAKCRKAIEDYRKNRTAEAVRAEQLVIKKERHEVFKEKSKPEPTIQELLDQMMAQKAERDRLKQPTQPTQPEQL
jgi:hypothetical protein